MAKAKGTPKKAAKAAAAPAPTKQAAPAPARGLTACACSRFRVLVNVRDTDEGDLTWDDEVTTGCAGGKTKATFLPGHDAKLKSFLIKAGINGWDVREDTGGVDICGDALTHARKFGFDYMVAAGIKRGVEKVTTKKPAKKAAAKKTTPAAKQAEPAPASLADVVLTEEAAHLKAELDKVATREATAEWTDTDEAKIADQPQAGTEGATCELTGKPEVKAKVGRWEYTGVVCEAEHLHYMAKDGHTRKTAEAGKFEVLAEV